jgi:hypothetical protein
MRHALFTASILLVLPLAGCTLPDLDEDDGASTEGSTGGTTPPTTSSTGSESGSAEGSGSESAEESGSAGESEGSTTDGPMPATCTDATLFAGNPYFNGDLEGWNPAGQPLLADPPLRSRHLAVTGGQLAIETQSEVWIADDVEVHRIAGDELEFELQYQPAGACADVRFITATGVGAMPNGDLVVLDARGNGVVELADPLGDCMARPIAGNQEQTFDVDIDGGAANAGDVDGPGAQAQFFGPERPTVDADGNIYLSDAGNGKIKRIANDADRTVSTLHSFPGEEFALAMTAMDGTLYVTGQNVTEDVVLAIDLESGAVTELFRGRGLFEELDSSQQATMFALANDGVDLLVGSNKGYIFRLSTTGEPLGVVAGMGQFADFPADLDLTMPIALDMLPLRSFAVGDANLVRMGNDFMFTGTAGGIGFHIWAIHC